MKQRFLTKCEKHNQDIVVSYQFLNQSLEICGCQFDCINCTVEMYEKILFLTLEDFECKYLDMKNLTSSKR